MKTLKDLLNFVASKLKTEEVKAPLAPASFGKEEIELGLKDVDLSTFLFKLSLNKGQTKEAAIQSVNELLKNNNLIIVHVPDYSTESEVIVKVIDVETLFSGKQAFELQIFKNRLAEKSELDKRAEEYIVSQCLAIIDGKVTTYDELIAYEAKLSKLMA